MKAFTLAPVRFDFGHVKDRSDKLRGLVEGGPYQQLDNPPTFGFVFPNEYRDYANQLYLSMKNGVDPFKGVENTFRFKLSKDQVFSISGFSLRSRNPHENAKQYEHVILDWIGGNNPKPDMFFVIHPQTPVTDADTPYYACKARLLSAGIISQSVTSDLLRDKDRLRWSVANIALGAFVKLGGTPWIVHGSEPDQELIIGLGRSYLYDRQSRQLTGYMGFTSCFSARGRFQFVALADVADSREAYLPMLQNIVKESLKRVEGMDSAISSLTLHVPKEMNKEEMRAINAAISTYKREKIPQLTVVKVSEEETFFAVDSDFRDGVPRRGTAIQINDRDYLLYTEGREEREPWVTSRLPVALRVTPQASLQNPIAAKSLLRQVNDLSQVNWRGFNARSKPISAYYATLIARLLSHTPSTQLKALDPVTKQLLESRMWFI